MRILRLLLTFHLLLFCVKPSYSQGCSDAGFCTMGSTMPSVVQDSVYHQHFKLTLGYGAGEQGVTIMQAIPELELYFLKNYMFQVKIPINFISGNLGENNGAGDVALGLSRRFVKNESTSYSVSAGIKLPTGTTDATDGNTVSLPMPYQTGLGTTDLVLGVAWKFKSWNVSGGYQKVLQHDNNNTFLRARYPGDSDAQGYFESNGLERGDDVLLRLEKQFRLKKLFITPGILGIYRLKEDQIHDITGTKVAAKGSDGVTLNVTATAQYPFSDRLDLQVMLGAPVVVREVRPDGLTRSLVLNFGFRYNFNFRKK